MNQKQKYKEILKSLERAYPGKINLSVGEFALAAGMAKGTVYNRISDKSISVPIIKIGNRPKVRVHDAARYLSNL